MTQAEPCQTRGPGRGFPRADRGFGFQGNAHARGVIACKPYRGEAARERPISAIAQRLSTKIADLTGGQPTVGPQIALDQPGHCRPSGDWEGCRGPGMTATARGTVK